MFSIIRTLAVYLLVLFLLRTTSKRSLSNMSPFEFVLLMMMGGIAVPSMQGDDRSLTNALLIICTLMGTHLLLAWLKQRYRTAEKVIEGTPMVVLEDGKPLEDRMRKMLIHDQDILQAVREKGLERLEQAKYAIVERNGVIVVIPKKE